MVYLRVMTDETWIPWWEQCPQKNYISHAPDFSGLDPDTGEPWSPIKIVKILGLRAVNDPEDIRVICQKVVEADPKKVAIYRKGKTKILGYFFKQVLDETKNGANAEITRQILEELLRSPESSSDS